MARKRSRLTLGRAWAVVAISIALSAAVAEGQPPVVKVGGARAETGVSARDNRALGPVAGHLTLTAPSGPDVTIRRGATYPVTWTSASLPLNAKVVITLRNGAEESWVLANGVPNKGSWIWRVGTWNSRTQAVYEDDDDYRMEIRSIDGTLVDASEADFAIGTAQSITVAGPLHPLKNSTRNYACTVQFNVGSDQDVSALVKWVVLAPNPKKPGRYKKCKFAAMLPGGALVSREVATDQPVRISASLGKGKSALSDYLDVTITVENAAPSAEAGEDQTITLPDAATLDATVSDDENPGPPAGLTVLWTKQSGPGTVTFGDATAVDTTAQFSERGDVRFAADRR